jgi:hypothetical protein
VVADSGIENVNNAVDSILESAKLRRVLALVEVTYSNSIIEAWWRSLKHQWLYLNTLDTMTRLETLIAFFVESHNVQMPHSAFRGQTPDEMYFETAATLPDDLAAARNKARDPAIGREPSRVLRPLLRAACAGDCTAESFVTLWMLHLRTHSPECSRTQQRWTATAMREASTKFRRIAGHKDMPRLIRALRAHEIVERQESVAQAVTRPPRIAAAPVGVEVSPPGLSKVSPM